MGKIIELVAGFLLKKGINPKIAGFVAGLVIYLGSVITGGWIGYKVASNLCYLEKMTAVELAVKQAEEQAVIDAQIMDEGAKVETIIRTVYVNTEQEIDKNADKIPDCNLGNEFIRLWNKPLQTSTDTVKSSSDIHD